MGDAYREVPGFLKKCKAALDAMKDGHHAEAASVFEWAWEAAFGVGDMMQAKMVGTNAVLAYVKAGDAASALRTATKIVDTFHRAGKSDEIPGLAKHFLEPLRAHGHAAEADTLSSHIAGVTGR
jgi:hypothetical protein